MKPLFTIGAFSFLLLQGLVADGPSHDTLLQSRVQTLTAGQYNNLFEKAVANGELDLKEEQIPSSIRRNKRYCDFYQAGYIRGIRSYLTATGLKNGEGLGIYENQYRNEFHWELEGFIAGCKAAKAVGDKIMTGIDQTIAEVYSKTSDWNVTITNLEKQFADSRDHESKDGSKSSAPSKP